MPSGGCTDFVPEPLMELDAWLEPYRAEWAGPARFARAAPATHRRHRSPRVQRNTDERPSPAPLRRHRWSAPPTAASSDSNATSPTRSATSGTRSRTRRGWRTGGCRSTPTSPSTSAKAAQMVFAGRGDEPMTITCTILRVEPPMLLEHTHVDPGSYMRWELEPVDTGCVSAARATSSPTPTPRSTTATSSDCTPRSPRLGAVPRRSPRRVGLGRLRRRAGALRQPRSRTAGGAP